MRIVAHVLIFLICLPDLPPVSKCQRGSVTIDYPFVTRLNKPRVVAPLDSHAAATPHLRVPVRGQRGGGEPLVDEYVEALKGYSHQLWLREKMVHGRRECETPF